jgi:starch phosphorylase
MANLATVGSHHVNGVAALHSELVRTELFPDYATIWPEKFLNVTNGVTPRRWIALANPLLRSLLDETISADWVRDLDLLRELERFQHDSAFLERWGQMKLAVKRRLTTYVHQATGLLVDPATMFDVQVKRIHEYKRQHLNALQVIVQYLRIKHGLADGQAPRTVIFGGKAAPGYYMAKLIIRFLNGIADTVNADPDMDGRLRVIFLADYNVKLGERVYPASDLSEQISTAGLEASGTGNMKFAMNGALTIGTLDGANVEIREQVGEENFFLFGRTTDGIEDLRREGYCPWEWINGMPELAEALRLIEQGHFSNGDTELFKPLLENLTGRDPFYVLADFTDYLRAQDAVSAAWADREHWNRMSLLNTARTGFFSSDRSIREYAERIWKVKPFPITISCAIEGAESP